MNQELILVDGYNFIHQVTRFKRVLAQGFEIAREDLIQEFLKFSDQTDAEIWIIFDSKAPSIQEESLVSLAGFRVIYTRRGMEADTYIEKTVYEKQKEAIRMRVVSDDRMVQSMVLGKGAFVSSPEVFYQEMCSLAS